MNLERTALLIQCYLSLQIDLINATFFAQSELFDPVLPPAAQLDIHFYCLYYTELEIHLLEGPDLGHSTDEGIKEKI